MVCAYGLSIFIHWSNLQHCKYGESRSYTTKKGKKAKVTQGMMSHTLWIRLPEKNEKKKCCTKHVAHEVPAIKEKIPYLFFFLNPVPKYASF